MDQFKFVGMFANDVSNENTEHEAPAVNGAKKEIRPLSDLELMVTGGGDAVVCW
jgi:hypothetical protein